MGMTMDECAREDCRFSYSGSMMTLMGWTPTYDKRGNQIGGLDPNTTTRTRTCHSCGNSWSVSSKAGHPDDVRELAGGG